LSEPLPGDGAGEDCARAEISSSLDGAALFAFVREIERLFRLNPHLAIETWEQRPDGFRLAARNESNECSIDTAARVEADAAKRTLAIHYANGLKRSTTITVEPAASGNGSRLIVVDHYPLIADKADPRVAEVDRSLVPWLAAIYRHLLARARWGRIPGWHWWNERFLPGMVPRSRRIVRMIVWVSVLEFVVFLGLVVILVAAQ
jgi:hypothetical protein